MAEGGRPAKLTPEMAAEIPNLIRLGASRVDAAQFSGIDPKTLRRWIELGAEEQRGPYADLRAAVLQAEASRKVGWLATVVGAASHGDVKAATWLLERFHPAEFGDRSVLFLVKNALDEMERAAAAAGIPLPGNAWEQAWATVARQLSQGLPEAVAGIGPGAAANLQGFDSPEDLDLALRLLGRKRHGGNGTAR